MSKIYQDLTSCQVCPRYCNINRYREMGFCHATANLKVNLHQLHFGEEPVISGSHGSGTIFFSHCNLRCEFCQNHTISNLGWGNEITNEACVQMMLDLQSKGAHNINLVTPSHYSIPLIEVIQSAKQQGLIIPIVWNSNAYENVSVLKSLEGLIDIYLPDLKYSDTIHSATYSHASNYTENARKAIIEMKRQVGLLKCDDNNIAYKGLIIRLLVLPNNIAGASDTLHWIADALGEDTYISLMAQYYPTWNAGKHPEINRGITQAEYDEVLQTIDKLGFENGFIQELSCSNEWTPDFKNPTKVSVESCK